MTNQKLISILQSRIAKRKKFIADGHVFAMEFSKGSPNYKFAHSVSASHSEEQRQDKAIMKALIEAELRKRTYTEIVYSLCDEIAKWKGLCNEHDTNNTTTN